MMCQWLGHWGQLLNSVQPAFRITGPTNVTRLRSTIQGMAPMNNVMARVLPATVDVDVDQHAATVEVAHVTVAEPAIKLWNLFLSRSKQSVNVLKRVEATTYYRSSLGVQKSS